MNKMILALAATAALAAALPAAAQPYQGGYGYPGSGYNSGNSDYNARYQDFSRQFAEVARDLRSAQQDESLEDWQARQFWGQLRDIRQREATFRRNDGYLNRWERRDIQMRLQSLQSRIEAATNDDSNNDDHDWRR
jgi:hypothetical protein